MGQIECKYRLSLSCSKSRIFYFGHLDGRVKYYYVCKECFDLSEQISKRFKISGALEGVELVK